MKTLDSFEKKLTTPYFRVYFQTIAERGNNFCYSENAHHKEGFTTS
jgi:hypothetical protein